MSSRKQALRLHSSYAQKIKQACEETDVLRLARVLRVLGDEFSDDYEALLKRNVEDAVAEGAKVAQHMIDMMLPKGVRPPGREQAPDFWARDFKGETPEVRLARFRVTVRKKLNSVTTRRFAEAPPIKKAVVGFPEEPEFEEMAAQLWESGDVKNAALLMAGESPWAGSLIGLLSTLEDNGEAIDHWEHSAVLDASTCEECADLDGTEIPAHGADEPWEVVDIHPNCRCVPIPVSKTWEELAQELDIPELVDMNDIPYPEGQQIVRADEKGQASPTGFLDENGKYHAWVPDVNAEGHLVGDNWQPGWEPTGGTQYYTPPSERYEKWQKGEA